MKKIIVTGCSSCVRKYYSNRPGNVEFVPMCRLSDREIPHTVVPGFRGMLVASLADDFIPDWCELEDDIRES